MATHAMIRKADLDHLFRQPGPMPPQQPPHAPHSQYNAAQIHAQQRADQERREKMRRLAMAPTDKNIPEGVEDICIGDGVSRYRELRDVERTLDATMMRKKLEAADFKHHSHSRRFGTMRIWISNTAANQPWQNTAIDADSFDFDSGTSPTYRVKIQGRLLEDDGDDGLGDDEQEEKDPDAMDEDDAEPTKPGSVEKEKPKVFSQFFTSITVDFDRAKSLQPDNFTQIEWKRPEQPAAAEKADFSELEFERKGDENINITINLHKLHMPERSRLSQPLAELLDRDEDDRAGVIMGIWEYARSQGLQHDDDERKFTCDAKLKAIFNQDVFFIPLLPQLTKAHMTALPPVQLKYTIRVDKDYISPDPASGVPPSRPTIYDVQVPLDDALAPLLDKVVHPENKGMLEQIRAIDDQIVLLMSGIRQSKAKHAFFTSMAKDPAAFVKRWLSSQKRDLEVIMGEATRGGGEDASGGEWQRGGPDGVWASEVAKESVALWLARQGVKGH